MLNTFFVLGQRMTNVVLIFEYQFLEELLVLLNLPKILRKNQWLKWLLKNLLSNNLMLLVTLQNLVELYIIRKLKTTLSISSRIRILANQTKIIIIIITRQATKMV